MSKVCIVLVCFEIDGSVRYYPCIGGITCILNKSYAYIILVMSISKRVAFMHLWSMGQSCLVDLIIMIIKL
jgi:hypothetical protein